jgi:hypothetical protein
VLGGYLSVFYKHLVPVIETLEILLFQFQENSESNEPSIPVFLGQKASKRTCAFHEIIGKELAEGYFDGY